MSMSLMPFFNAIGRSYHNLFSDGDVQERITGAPGGYYASLVAGDGRLYVASLAGKLTVIKAGGDKPEILHQADFGERILATPAIVGERLYVRTTTKLWAFGK